MDPRLEVIDSRFEQIGTPIAVSGGKGGIGKSLVASTLALILSDLGHRVGLLDLDFCGPSAHVILGTRGDYPREEKGIIPPHIHGIKFMSIVHYTGNNPSPLRGIDISNAMIELLATTLWGPLDYLIIDTPPGIGDATLDIIRLIKKAKFLVVATRSKVVLETVKKVLALQKELGVPIIGVVENMKTMESSFVEDEIKTYDVSFLGRIDFDENVEDSIGDVGKLLKTGFAEDVKKIILNAPAFELKEGPAKS